jgi:hypothetical protein
VTPIRQYDTNSASAMATDACARSTRLSFTAFLRGRIFKGL